MKKLLAVGLLGLAAIIANAMPIRVWWINLNDNSFSTNGINFYYTTNLALPTNQWPLLNFVTNAPSGSNSFVVDLPPANYFVIAKFTNTFWHLEFPFVGGASTPLIPTNLVDPLSLDNH